MEVFPQNYLLMVPPFSSIWIDLNRTLNIINHPLIHFGVPPLLGNLHMGPIFHQDRQQVPRRRQQVPRRLATEIYFFLSDVWCLI